MTREEKIAELINIRDNFNYTLAPREVFDDAIKALEQVPCEDAISRQEVIDAIDKWVKAEHILETLPTDKVTPLFKNVHKLPPVNPQPKTGYWIDADGDNAICGCCNRLNHLYGTYCKHCGTKMINPKESEDL